MTTRRHIMPFGAQLTTRGTRFRLWAPGCERVQLCIEGQADLAMAPLGDGWHELSVPDVGAGSRYRYEVNDGLRVPDPASRYNPDDVHGASEVIDPAAYVWHDAAWRGRPWHEAVIYEIHVGAYSPEGDFAGVMARLDELVELGVTALELMPVADFPGSRNWGYDGVLPFAPDSTYGRPEVLKALIDAAHQRGLMVLLDVVYNHFGPDGNYLHVYAKRFFNFHLATPWGAAINFSEPVVRTFFIHNALYWLEEFHLDGLRLDAVHAFQDETQPHFLDVLAARIRAAIGGRRAGHLILENDANQARRLAPVGTYRAQWNDDFHHALHVLLTGETDGYYADYADQPIRHLARCLAEGFAYQGESSAYRGQAPRGEASAHLPATAFITYLQCHDQVGNRALGERIHALAPTAALHAAVAICLLAPSIPLLFMGEEFAAASPFPFFCDFTGDLGQAVSAGRRQEFARFTRFGHTEIPDPNQAETYLSAKLDRDGPVAPVHTETLAQYRTLLRLRRERLVPHLSGLTGHAARYEILSPTTFSLRWRLGDGATLHLLAHLGDEPVPTPAFLPPGDCLYATATITAESLPDWFVLWTLEEAGV